MRFPRIRTLIVVPLVGFGLFYLGAAIALIFRDSGVEPFTGQPQAYRTIAIFGASGTAGDGILKTALADPEIETIHVITRRSTPRIEQGVGSGKVLATRHMDYLDYTPIELQLANVDAVYWAIGTSTFNVDAETYSVIHVDFPARFLETWLAAGQRPNRSFHYISSSDISEDASAHWAREKFRAEQTLFALARGTDLRVIAYRPDYIGPTAEDSSIRQELLYGFFAPVGVAVRAEAIGRAMFEITARLDELEKGMRVGTLSILDYSDAYDRRVGP